MRLTITNGNVETAPPNPMGSKMTDLSPPSVQLSARVVALLIEEGLLRPERKAELEANISAGTIKGADWRLEIELAGSKADAT